MRKIIAVLLGFCVFSSLLISCTKKEEPYAEQKLEIVISNYGYGYEWLNDQIALFKEQGWVKDKYPNLVIPAPVTNNSDRTYCIDQIAAGPKSNDADLFFSCNTAGLKVNTTYKDTSVFEDLTTAFYESTIPGESQKVKDKMIAEIYRDYAISHDGVTSYYGMPWVNGYMGLFLNATLVKNSLGEDYVLPKTTDELTDFVADLKGEDLTPFVFAASANYWVQMFQTWWAQYDGVKSEYDSIEGYNDFWNGQIDGAYTREIFNNNQETSVYKGRYKSLLVIESLIKYGSENYHESSASFKAVAAQQAFFNGEGVMMPNGDWLDTEMKAAGYQNDKDYEITLLKTPVISSITEQLTSVKTDEELSFVVGLVDENKTYEEAKAEFEVEFDKTITSADYARVNEARRVIYRLEGHEAYVPSYSVAKGLAIDFLRFLATDISIAQFMKSTGGCETSFKFNVKESDVWNDLTPLQKAHAEFVENGVQMPTFTSFKLHYYGSLSPLTQTPQLDLAFINPSATARKTAYQIVEDDYKKFSQSEFDALLIKSGIK